MSSLRKTVRRAQWVVEELVPGFLIGAIAIIITIAVFSRYVMGVSLSWPNEVVTALFLWCVFLAAAGAFRYRMHISLDLFTSVRAPSFQRLLQYVTAVLSAGIMMVAIYLAWQFSLVSTKRLQITGLNYVWIYSAVSVGMAFSCLHILARPSIMEPDPLPDPALGMREKDTRGFEDSA